MYSHDNKSWFFKARNFQYFYRPLFYSTVWTWILRYKRQILDCIVIFIARSAPGKFCLKVAEYRIIKKEIKLENKV